MTWASPDDEVAWRQGIAVGDAVAIHSTSAGGWLQGRVSRAAKDRVKVEYVVDTELCDKNLLRSSPDLRPPGSGVVGQRSGMQNRDADGPLGGSGAKHLQPQMWPLEQPQQLPRDPQPQHRLVAATAPPLGHGVGYAGDAPLAAAARPLPGNGYVADQGVRRYADACPPAAAPQHVAPPALVDNYQPQAPSEAPNPRQRPMSFAPEEWLRVEDLHLSDLLGSGGFGSVHRGTLRGEAVAVKKLRLDGLQISPEQLQEFQKEILNLQALRHPRLIRFIGVAFEPPTLCIVTELAAGGSLHHLLHVDKRPLLEAQRRTLVLQVTEGTAFLHSRRPPFVHRDLKSPNVVLDKDLCAKLCDFGLTESMEKTHISRRSSEGGSPRYMAPEIFDARSKLTEKLDVWALGCLSIEILTAQLPHEDCSNIQQVAAKLLVRREPPYPASWSRGFQPEVASLVFSCFAWTASSRPAATQLFGALLQIESFTT